MVYYSNKVYIFFKLHDSTAVSLKSNMPDAPTIILAYH